MEAEMESNERGGGILNQMMGYGMRTKMILEREGTKGIYFYDCVLILLYLSLIHFFSLLLVEEKIKKTNRKNTCS